MTASLNLIVHADWGSDPKKRWMCVAESESDGVFTALVPEPVGDPTTLIRRLIERERGRIFLGFDFPIGVPMAYARSLGITSFTELLRELGTGIFLRFFEPAESAAEICLVRPFYPRRPGGTKRQHLLDGLRLSEYKQLLRLCERATSTRGNACSLFWTLGGQQVGRAAIIGWRDVLRPALVDESIAVALWPFEGDLDLLLEEHQLVIAETYPAEAAVHIGIGPPGRGWSKRSQAHRAARSELICHFADQSGIRLAPELKEQVRAGFGSSLDGEDRFDAALGLVSMIAVVKGFRSPGTPPVGEMRDVEGWILGQEYPSNHL
jgi:hypothetical protein